MHYSPAIMGKSLREVADILRVTEPTLRLWMLTGKIRPVVTKIRSRNYYDFPEEEIERVKRLINKKWTQGKKKL